MEPCDEGLSTGSPPAHSRQGRATLWVTRSSCSDPFLRHVIEVDRVRTFAVKRPVWASFLLDSSELSVALFHIHNTFRGELFGPFDSPLLGRRYGASRDYA